MKAREEFKTAGCEDLYFHYIQSSQDGDLGSGRTRIWDVTSLSDYFCVYSASCKNSKGYLEMFRSQYPERTFIRSKRRP